MTLRYRAGGGGGGASGMFRRSSISGVSLLSRDDVRETVGDGVSRGVIWRWHVRPLPPSTLTAFSTVMLAPSVPGVFRASMSIGDGPTPAMSALIVRAASSSIGIGSAPTAAPTSATVVLVDPPVGTPHRALPVPGTSCVAVSVAFRVSSRDFPKTSSTDAVSARNFIQ